MRGSVWLAAGAVLTVAGCASVPRSAVVPPDGGPVVNANEPTPPGAGTGVRVPVASVDLTPWIDVARGQPAAGEAGVNPVGAYVRLRVVGDIPGRAGSPEAAGRYDRERRSAPERWLWGQAISRVFSIKMSLSRPNISLTTAFASAGHRSTRRDGETWVTDFNQHRLSTPYFRVEPQATATIQSSIAASSAIDGKLTAAVLGTVLRAATLLAPTASLVTTLNEDRFRQAAEFVDASISTLFGQSITEQISTDVDLMARPADGRVARIRAYFPPGESRVIAQGQPEHIGTWDILMDAPIVSIFSPTPWTAPAGASAGACGAVTAGPDRQACVAFTGLSAQTVLGLKLGENVELRQAIAGDPGIQSTIKQIDDSSGETVRAARSLCHAIAARAEGLGLNRYDAAAATWATATAGPVSARVSDALRAEALCAPMSLARTVGLR